MKNRILVLGMLALMGTSVLAGCAGTEETAQVPSESTVQSEAASDHGQVADSSDMAEVIDVVEEDMVPITAESLQEGSYPITVDSSSSMFRIDGCRLRVSDGKMVADMTMSGTGYLYVYMGTGEEAASADEKDLISFTESDIGEHIFTVPVEALDQGLDCAAFSKRKEQWYERTLVFRSDSLPVEAFAEGVVPTAESLGLADGIYETGVTLEGGSGKASVASPARITVSGGKATAEIIWSSPNYDYMIVDGEKYLPVNEEGNSVFEIPVAGFDHRLSVSADTTAMSKPHEIEYTLRFDSDALKAVEE